MTHEKKVVIEEDREALLRVTPRDDATGTYSILVTTGMVGSSVTRSRLTHGKADVDDLRKLWSDFSAKKVLGEGGIVGWTRNRVYSDRIIG